MTPHKRYVVMHDYGSEGWKIVTECDTMTEAVFAREDDLSNGGGDSAIFEWWHPVAAYGSASYQRGLTA